jgi:hypothetical protein
MEPTLCEKAFPKELLPLTSTLLSLTEDRFTTVIFVGSWQLVRSVPTDRSRITNVFFIINMIKILNYIFDPQTLWKSTLYRTKKQIFLSTLLLCSISHHKTFGMVLTLVGLTHNRFPPLELSTKHGQTVVNVCNFLGE